MSSSTQPGRDCCCTKTPRGMHQHARRRRASRPMAIVAVVACGSVLVPPSRAWVLLLPYSGEARTSMTRRMCAAGMPPIRRRTLVEDGNAPRERSLCLSASPVTDVVSRLENMAWSDVDAAVDHSGDDLFGDARMDGAVRLPAYEQNLEGRGQQGFEGPEKTLEIEFDPDVGHEAGLRAIRREQWDAILEQSQCQILNHRGNEFFDSYVLSESSLFVYNSKLVLKTCGTTTLLRCLPLLAVVAKNYGLHLAWLGYSRKDFTFPTDQIYPHTSFAQEVDFLQTMFTGSAYVHGPLDNDHWYTYVADHCRRLTRAAADRTLNMMMYGLEPEVAQHFFRSDKIKTAEDVSWQSGIRAVLPRAELQDHLFEPCGYSMNALEGQAYYTVHVTPEPDFSYASFETNVRLPNYDDIVRGVLEVFRPNKFTMTLIADKSAMDNMKQNPFDADHIECAANRASPNDGARYRRTLKTTANFAGDYLSQMGNWVREVRDPAATGAAYL